MFLFVLFQIGLRVMGMKCVYTANDSKIMLLWKLNLTSTVLAGFCKNGIFFIVLFKNWRFESVHFGLCKDVFVRWGKLTLVSWTIDFEIQSIYEHEGPLIQYTRQHHQFIKLTLQTNIDDNDQGISDINQLLFSYLSSYLSQERLIQFN